MGEPVQQGSGQAFGAEDFGPLFKGQVCGDQEADTFVSTADHIEQEFGPGFGEGHEAQFVEDDQVLAFQLLVETVKGSVLPALQQMGDQARDGEEASPGWILQKDRGTRPGR